jgi:lipopolysaccharide/colanic/teichoic acid biosynthesis glycosyltransferase/glycosyltransferase involved in cell wall biosynthesis
VKSGSEDRTKRVFDVAIAVLLLVLTLPIQLATALAIRIRLGSPVIFRHTRPGLHSQPFELIKFRSMSNVDPARSLIDDASRMTPFGLWLRATSLDELPSLWNVVRGDLSLVGPRPLMMSYLGRYSPEQARRHDVRPGITGLAQISGRNALSWEDKFRLDVHYVDHHTFMGDLRILGGTVRAVVRREGISQEGETTSSEFMGPPPDHTREPVTMSKPVALVTATIPITVDGFDRELIRQVQAQGYDVCVVSSPGPMLTRVGEEMGVRIRALPMTREISLVADLIALVAWLRVCLAERPSLMISATPKASLLSLLAGKATHVERRLYRLAGLRLEGEHGRRRQLLAVMEKITSWASTEVVANSPSLTARYAALRLTPQRKLRQTRPGSGHGVDSVYFSPRLPDLKLANELGIDRSMPVVGLVGRLRHDKGVDTLIDAMRLLHADAVPCQLLVVGRNDSNSAVYFDALAAVGEHVVAVGEVDDVRPYFALMDVHVLPSLREGFPNVVLEASAMGLPTIATNATGAIDSVRDGETGLIVKTQDPPGLADAIKTLLHDPDRASQYGVEARKWVVDDFQPQSVVATLLAFGNVANAASPHSSGERSNVAERR